MRQRRHRRPRWSRSRSRSPSLARRRLQIRPRRRLRIRPRPLQDPSIRPSRWHRARRKVPHALRPQSRVPESSITWPVTNVTEMTGVVSRHRRRAKLGTTSASHRASIAPVVSSPVPVTSAMTARSVARLASVIRVRTRVVLLVWIRRCPVLAANRRRCWWVRSCAPVTGPIPKQGAQLDSADVANAASRSRRQTPTLSGNLRSWS